MFFCGVLLEAPASLWFCISKACTQTQPSGFIYEHQLLIIQLCVQWQSESELSQSTLQPLNIRFLKNEALKKIKPFTEMTTWIIYCYFFSQNAFNSL